jgi:hypothetical protein
MVFVYEMWWLAWSLHGEVCDLKNVTAISEKLSAFIVEADVFSLIPPFGWDDRVAFRLAR